MERTGSTPVLCMESRGKSLFRWSLCISILVFRAAIMPQMPRSDRTRRKGYSLVGFKGQNPTRKGEGSFLFPKKKKRKNTTHVPGEYQGQREREIILKTHQKVPYAGFSTSKGMFDTHGFSWGGFCVDFIPSIPIS